MKTETDGNTITLFFDGDLTDDVAAKATKTCAKTIAKLKEEQRLSIDLSTTDDIEPEGIALLIALCAEAEINGLEFTIIGAPDSTQHLLTTLGLSKRFALAT